MRSSTLQLDAMVSIKAHIPEDAMSASLLGTERTGHGARIREDGLIATIGYVISEAETVWIGANNGMLVPGFAVGYDFDSGFGLVRPAMPMEGPTFELGTTATLPVGAPVTVTASGKADQIVHAEVVAKQEFAGRWEYLLEEAVFTSPAHESWSGAALIDGEGRLCGLGSLLIQGFESAKDASAANMFVPIDLLEPIIDDICEHGRRTAPPRPWLGVLVHEDRNDRLTIVGVYRNCPRRQGRTQARRRDCACRRRPGEEPGDDVAQGLESRPRRGRSADQRRARCQDPAHRCRVRRPRGISARRHRSVAPRTDVCNQTIRAGRS